jgi:CRP-like cAMP-binding protein
MLTEISYFYIGNTSMHGFATGVWNYHMSRNILLDIGNFSEPEARLFEMSTTRRLLGKNEMLLQAGGVCQAVYYVLSGAFCQFQPGETEDVTIDLHVQHDWVFNHASLISQSPSQTSIRAFTESEVLELTLARLHELIARSQAFLQFGRILNPGQARTHFFDNSLDPRQKYDYLLATKPQIARIFPLKLIASYLKVAPETLSRVRANFRIS